MDEVLAILMFAEGRLKNSKEGLETYEDDVDADHGDGQQVGREYAYREIIKRCAERLIILCE